MKLTAALQGDRKSNEHSVSSPWRGLARCVGLLCAVFLVTAFSLSSLPYPAFAVDKKLPEYSYQVSVHEFKPEELKSFQLELKQPYALDARRVSVALSRLAYQQKKILWSGKKRVFPPALVKLLAPQITQGFRRAGSHDRIVFQVKNAKGRSYLAGDVFLASNGLHWRVTILKYESRAIGDFSVSGERWRLAPLEGQSYMTLKPFPDLKQELTNWIYFETIRPSPEGLLKEVEPSSESPPSSGASIEGTSDSIKERLRVLEELKRDHLIRPQEYERKRKEILDRL
ncbi:MAG: hypothetical protein G3M78_10185 [Candidatus Nitrohelix vancouverensis]|uniref:SHOCT domain-containing protein n=1 Tax=Candidatus Nitrohelix vancouverensis TaxID=2705534 RepID=A0A7T0C380_9BACT|nr:MAG: hypothetical protein G3M78_10185 [Candidatus Nitrohelix vancouverensis]